MQQQQPLLSTQDFNMAAEIDTHNPDVYHHRGQVGNTAEWFILYLFHFLCFYLSAERGSLFKLHITLPVMKPTTHEVYE